MYPFLVQKRTNLKANVLPTISIYFYRKHWCYRKMKIPGIKFDGNCLIVSVFFVYGKRENNTWGQLIKFQYLPADHYFMKQVFSS